MTVNNKLEGRGHGPIYGNIQAFALKYSDPLSNTGVRKSDHGMLGKTILLQLLREKIGLRERGRLWTSNRIAYNTYKFLNKTFIKCFGS